MRLKPGENDNPEIDPGSTLEAPAGGGSLQNLTDRAPAFADKADSVLTRANATIGGLNGQLQDPESDFRRTLASLRRMSSNLEDVTTSEKQTIRALIQNLERISGDLEAFTSENSDSLGVTVRRLNESLDRLNRSLASFEKSSAALDRITMKINEGEGTAGRLVNDPGLYMKMDSVATRTNSILEDFEKNPNRYLEDMTLVEMF